MNIPGECFEDVQFARGWISAVLAHVKAEQVIVQLLEELKGVKEDHKHYVAVVERQAAYNSECLDIMDEIAAKNTIMVGCRSCSNDYELPCDLSEFDPTMSYCGRSQHCCP